MGVIVIKVVCTTQKLLQQNRERKSLKPVLCGNKMSPPEPYWDRIEQNAVGKLCCSSLWQDLGLISQSQITGELNPFLFSFPSSLTQINSNINERIACAFDLVIEMEWCSLCMKGYWMDSKRSGKNKKTQVFSACHFKEVFFIQWEQENENKCMIFPFWVVNQAKRKKVRKHIQNLEWK